MPIYEYRCGQCRKKVTLLILKSDQTPRCSFCGGSSLERLFSRFATVRSEEDRLERLADPSNLAGLDENDPQSVARWVKKMGRELGEDLGEDFETGLDEALSKEEF